MGLRFFWWDASTIKKVYIIGGTIVASALALGLGLGFGIKSTPYVEPIPAGWEQYRYTAENVTAPDNRFSYSLDGFSRNYDIDPDTGLPFEVTTQDEFVAMSTGDYYSEWWDTNSTINTDGDFAIKQADGSSRTLHVKGTASSPKVYLFNFVWGLEFVEFTLSTDVTLTAEGSSSIASNIIPPIPITMNHFDALSMNWGTTGGVVNQIQVTSTPSDYSLDGLSVLPPKIENITAGEATDVWDRIKTGDWGDIYSMVTSGALTYNLEKLSDPVVLPILTWI